MIDECYAPFSVLQVLFLPGTSRDVCLAILALPASRTQASLGFYFTIFSLTCLFEAPIYFGVGKYLKRPSKTLLWQILFLNLATHPIVFWLIPYLMERWHQDTLTMIASGEAFAIIVEALLLRTWQTYPWKIALPTSIAANCLSWGAGAWLQLHELLQHVY